MKKTLYKKSNVVRNVTTKHEADKLIRLGYEEVKEVKVEKKEEKKADKKGK